MRYFASGYVLLVLGVSAQLACNRDSTPTTPRASVAQTPQKEADPEPTPAGPLLDQLFLEVAQDVPGFAGIVIEDGAVVIRLVDTTQAAVARQAVERVFGSAPTIRGRLTRIVPARYSFVQLDSWRTSFLTSGMLTGVRLVDVDENRNALFVAAAELSMVPTVRQSIRSLGIPDDAVQIESVDSLRPLVDSLGNSVRPVVGGLVVGIWTGPGSTGYCSLGFKAKKVGSTRYILTNSHCTAGFGVLDGDSVGQPNSTKWIGNENQDPVFTSTNCSSGYTCRWSDAALVKCDSISTCTLYTIAKTTSEYTGSNWTSGSGSLELASDNWYVVGELGNSALVQGASISKVGFASGWTTGTINRTCTDLLDWPVTGKIMKCQFTSLAVNRSGDSGSPVFQYEASTGKAWLGGVMWGILYIGYYESVFSSIDGIKTDMGSLTVSSPIF